MKADPPLIAAIEAGGTKFNVAVGTGPMDLRMTKRIETTTPAEVLQQLIHFIQKANREVGRIQAIGLGSFGPVDLNVKSETYGYITTTPKGGWQYVDLVKPLKAKFRVPVGFDTDVNAAAMGEARWGAGRGCDPLVYMTVGTGVGGGIYVHGKPLHGVLHSEMGHMMVPPPHSRGAMDPRCYCPYHHTCLEGYISGPAIATRWGVRAEDLDDTHPAWAEVAETLAYGLTNVILMLSPKRIILGGGVMNHSALLQLTRSNVIKMINSYMNVTEVKDMDSYIVRPGLGDHSGVCGALLLGIDALGKAA
jgi:fructokinase